ncbi:MAG: hypothetical protein WC882_05135 [Candidatus Gracilibacteria bacterium]
MGIKIMESLDILLLLLLLENSAVPFKKYFMSLNGEERDIGKLDEIRPDPNGQEIGRMDVLVGTPGLDSESGNLGIPKKIIITAAMVKNWRERGDIY